MKTIMNDSRITSIQEIKEFLEHSKKFVIKLKTIEEKYEFLWDTILRFRYKRLKRKDKKVILLYVKKITGYKKAQVHRLVKRASNGNLVRRKYVRQNPSTKYNPTDIKLLEQTDELHLRLNSLATKEILRREYEVFGNKEYETVSQVSSSHINNLRKRNIYKSSWVNGTKPNEVKIGVTKQPEPNNMPGSLRVDTVHQRDVYHINIVDEVTQWEVVLTVPAITREYLIVGLRILFDQFPFKVFNFHSDRGSEFINQEVAQTLNELLIEQTKSRSRHCNDNALVESKNGSIVRKNFGYTHLDESLVKEINKFNKTYFRIYLNYHRPCLYETDIILDPKGREKKIYGQATTPYEKLKEVSKEQNKNFLKQGLTFEKLDIIAYEMSDNEFAKLLRGKQNEINNLNTKLHSNH